MLNLKQFKLDDLFQMEIKNLLNYLDNFEKEISQEYQPLVDDFDELDHDEWFAKYDCDIEDIYCGYYDVIHAIEDIQNYIHTFQELAYKAKYDVYGLYDAAEVIYESVEQLYNAVSELNNLAINPYYWQEKANSLKQSKAHYTSS